MKIRKSETEFENDCNDSARICLISKKLDISAETTKVPLIKYGWIGNILMFHFNSVVLQIEHLL